MLLGYVGLAEIERHESVRAMRRLSSASAILPRLVAPHHGQWKERITYGVQDFHAQRDFRFVQCATFARLSKRPSSVKPSGSFGSGTAFAC